MPYKQVIAVRGDLDLPAGKLAAQVAHASLEAALRSDNDVLDDWRRDGAKKVIVKASDEEKLSRLRGKAEQRGLPCYLVRDAGKTVVEAGTATALGVGPVEEDAVDAVTGSLPLL